ncbi:site-specific DNA-methyltransferase, partial [Vibrio parahaemolyticus]|nr:site-specific DNA-methyltransferase [Vibrio parahaemolyticus]
GLLWLNIGDSFTSGGRTWRDKDKKNPARGMSYRAPTPEGLKPKDLIGLPWRLALALQDDGWYLRSDNIWYKPNCQPESVKDRP